MLELLEHFTLTEIITFIVLFSLAFKGIATFCDWCWDWLKSKFDKDYQMKRTTENFSESIKRLDGLITQTQEEIDKINKLLNMLIESDKDSIKAWIVEKHHYYCYELKAIDYYTLESIERRYEHYKAENGNSYIASLVKELQALPKINNEQIEQTMILDKQNHEK